MNKLKSKISLAKLLIFSILITAAGCNKKNVVSDTDKSAMNVVNSYIEFANQKGKDYRSNSKRELSWYDWAAIGVADAVGGCEGAKLAAPLVPPWGSVAGGFIVGAAASYTTYVGLGGGTIPPPPPSDPSYGNDNNYYEAAGICHNLALCQCLNVNDSADLNLIYMSIANNINVITSDNICQDQLNNTIPYSVFVEAYTLNNFYSYEEYNEDEMYAYLNNFLDDTEASIISNYFANMYEIGNVEGCTNYSIEMEDYITESSLDTEYKAVILTGMSIFRHSINFWSNEI